MHIPLVNLHQIFNLKSKKWNDNLCSSLDLFFYSGQAWAKKHATPAFYKMDGSFLTQAKQFIKMGLIELGGLGGWISLEEWIYRIVRMDWIGYRKNIFKPVSTYLQ